MKHIWQATLNDIRASGALAAGTLALSTVPAILATWYLDPMAAFRANSVISLALLVPMIALIQQALERHGLMAEGERRSSYFFRVFAQGIVSGLGTIAGLLLFIVPGLFLFVRWSLSVVILIAKNGSILGSLRESWALTKGHEIRIATVFLPQWLLLGASLLIVAIAPEGPVNDIVSEILLSVALLLGWMLPVPLYRSLISDSSIPA